MKPIGTNLQLLIFAFVLFGCKENNTKTQLNLSTKKQEIQSKVSPKKPISCMNEDKKYIKRKTYFKKKHIEWRPGQNMGSAMRAAKQKWVQKATYKSNQMKRKRKVSIRKMTSSQMQKINQARSLFIYKMNQLRSKHKNNPKALRRLMNLEKRKIFAEQFRQVKKGN